MSKIKVSDLKGHLKDSSKVKEIKVGEMNLEVKPCITLEEKLGIVDGIMGLCWDGEIFDKVAYKTLIPYIIASNYVQNMSLPMITIEDKKEFDVAMIYNIFMNTDIYKSVMEVIYDDFMRLDDLMFEKAQSLKEEYEISSNALKGISKLINKFYEATDEDMEKYMEFVEKIKQDDTLKKLVGLDN